MNAADVMTGEVVTVRDDAPVPQVVRLLLARGISGVPVVNAAGVVVGVLSEGDLLRRAELGTEKRRGTWQEFFTGTATLAEDYVRAHGTLASDIMTHGAACVQCDTPLAEIAELMEAADQAPAGAGWRKAGRHCQPVQPAARVRLDGGGAGAGAVR